jgi:hypothetical protein
LFHLILFHKILPFSFKCGSCQRSSLRLALLLLLLRLYRFILLRCSLILFRLNSFRLVLGSVLVSRSSLSSSSLRALGSSVLALGTSILVVVLLFVRGSILMEILVSSLSRLLLLLSLLHVLRHHGGLTLRNLGELLLLNIESWRSLLRGHNRHSLHSLLESHSSHRGHRHSLSRRELHTHGRESHTHRGHHLRHHLRHHHRKR